MEAEAIARVKKEKPGGDKVQIPSFNIKEECDDLDESSVFSPNKFDSDDSLDDLDVKLKARIHPTLSNVPVKSIRDRESSDEISMECSEDEEDEEETDDSDDDNNEDDDDDDDDFLLTDSNSVSDFSGELDDDLSESDWDEFEESIKGSSREKVREQPDSSSETEDEDGKVQDGVKAAKIFEFDGMTIKSKGKFSTCPICKKNIRSTFILKHVKRHTEKCDKIKCPQKGCSMESSRVNNVFRHLKIIHKSKTPYFCRSTGCNEFFQKSEQLRQHSWIHRKKQKEKDEIVEDSEKHFACEFPGCEKVYGKRHHLREHERKHTGDARYKCEVCPRTFFIGAHMRRHMLSHTGLKPHTCRWKCGAVFASYGGRMKHERINHYKENPLKSECDICGRPMKNSQQLSKHRMTHLNPAERDKFRCTFCGIIIESESVRIRHEKRHRDGESYTCETCLKSFKNEKNLIHHIKKHHSSTTEKTDESSVPAKKSSFKEHLRHECHLCGPPKTFCFTSLRRHLARIHSQNYKCDWPECNRGFMEKAKYEAHMLLHKMRECHLCSKTFQRKQNADIHLMGVHNLTMQDLVELGRWRVRSKSAGNCPDYMKRSVRSVKKKQLQLARKNGAPEPKPRRKRAKDDNSKNPNLNSQSQTIATTQPMDTNKIGFVIGPTKKRTIEAIHDHEQEEYISDNLEDVEVVTCTKRPAEAPPKSYILAHGPNGFLSLKM